MYKYWYVYFNFVTFQEIKSQNSNFKITKCLYIWQGMLKMVSVLPNIDDNFELGLQIARRVWVTSYDGDKNVAHLAEK